MSENLANALNGIALAYLGDGVYEVFVRMHLLEKGVTRPNQLQKQAVQFVSAKAQADMIDTLAQQELLTSKELDVYHRGRNAKSYTKAKHTDVITYRMSTGFEALFGYLKLTDQNERIEELAKWCIDHVERKLAAHE
ncbi:RNase3 domain protein [Lapidilactobacillus concavus DSM 17758]|uniref:Mini-ribonuclease 3 n=1 Tax=Lapidilactobacillus concavus DSM 17758 TaxID=1423735 RepID=A0A0R1WFM6_9LACO|nr:Mini-ribonuclease 3 [Lapidilactobacillus concavus]KRM13702.1 RNase3 domain protein [Lapidilactobacillus concavus DSM 17758]GEL12844.1 mini-ribonuclease 3 [Lapidilactobacillus concavus]